jgi:vacuolar-type H+-ATPase subunit H
MKEDAKDTASNVVDEGKKKAEEAKEKAKETAHDAYDKTGQMSDEGMDRAKEKAGEAQESAARFSEDAKQKAKEAMDKVFFFFFLNKLQFVLMTSIIWLVVLGY